MRHIEVVRKMAAREREGEGGGEGGEVQERGKCNLRSPMIAVNVGCGGE